jgi:putative transposase
MKAKRYTEEQIIGVLKEAETGAKTELCRKYGISEVTFYNWKANVRRDDGIRRSASEGTRVRELEVEEAKGLFKNKFRHCGVISTY